MSQEELLKEQKAARHAQLAENAEVATAVKRKDEEVALERQAAQPSLTLTLTVTLTLALNPKPHPKP